MNAALAPRLAALSTLPALAPFLVRPASVSTHVAVAATGIDSLDLLLEGGFPRGRLSELVGPRSSGRTSVLLSVLARATTGGALSALVDATDGLDPGSAQARGVDLSRLLWVRCGGRLVAALRAADVIVRGGGFDVVAVDLGELPPWVVTRAPASAFVRLQRAVEAMPTALLVAGARRVTGSMAAVAIALTPRRVGWVGGGPGLMSALTAEARLIRSRERAPGAGARVRWEVDQRREPTVESRGA